MDENEAKELIKPVITKFKRRRIFVKGIDEIWQADLLILDAFSRENKGYKYILVVIDCFSKYAWCVALKKKNAEDVTDAFEQILTNSKRKPKFLQTDEGKEFVNATFQTFLKQFSIKWYHTYSEIKAAMVERFNRTLNEYFRLLFVKNKKHKWLAILPDILTHYNEKRIHGTTRLPPALVTKKNELAVRKRMYISHSKLEQPVFEVGERVRVTKWRPTFAYKYGARWSTEIFTIYKVIFYDRVIYYIHDSDAEEIYGGFYKQDLQRSRF